MIRHSGVGGRSVCIFSFLVPLWISCVVYCRWAEDYRNKISCVICLLYLTACKVNTKWTTREFWIFNLRPSQAAKAAMDAAPYADPLGKEEPGEPGEVEPPPAPVGSRPMKPAFRGPPGPRPGGFPPGPPGGLPGGPPGAGPGAPGLPMAPMAPMAIPGFEARKGQQFCSNIEVTI